MVTNAETDGFGGVADARSARPQFRSVPLVQVRRCGFACTAANKSARPELQLRTGASKPRQEMTDDSLSHLPLPARLGAYALMIGTFTGILPAYLAWGLEIAVNAAGAWLESLIGPAGMAALGLGTLFAIIIACLVALVRMCEVDHE